jgi:hypothetical protein
MLSGGTRARVETLLEVMLCDGDVQSTDDAALHHR